MEPVLKSKYRNVTKFLLWVGIIIAGFFLYPAISEQVKILSVKESRDELVDSLKKDISNSGKLIFPDGAPDSNLTLQGVFSFTNARRDENSLSRFFPNALLNQIALRRLDDMFAEQYFEHVSPSGKSASSEAEKIGYEYISIGENIALGNFQDDFALVLAWMNSPGHRANIVSEKFTELGVAVKKGIYEGRETWIAVQIFARPLTDCPTIDVGLKLEIEQINNQIDQNELVLSTKKGEIEKMENNRSNRQRYEQAVEEYNALVVETNTLIEKAKGIVSTYNSQVRLFNSCLE